jgi:hypothetical protein
MRLQTVDIRMLYEGEGLGFNILYPELGGMGFGFLGRDCGTFFGSIAEGQSFTHHRSILKLAPR